MSVSKACLFSSRFNFLLYVEVTGNLITEVLITKLCEHKFVLLRSFFFVYLIHSILRNHSDI